jgi:DNA-binding NarL/FixJ family response regulator
MSISISSSLSAASPAVANPSSNRAATQTVQQPAGNSRDTVRLSESQQVYQLYHQGRTVSQIASSLSLPVDLVNGYLNIASK